MTVISQFYDEMGMRIWFILLSAMIKNHSHQSLQHHFWIRSWLWTQIWSHVVAGLITLSTRFPFSSDETKNALIQSWSKKLLNLFGIQLKLNNPEILPEQTFLLTANHISWMDIHAINAFQPIRFVAKSDVESWPIFGWMAKQLGTVFIRRNNSRHGRHIANEVGRALRSQSVCIFPEGTTTVGDGVLPFKSNLFEAAVIAQVPVYSLAITYRSAITGVKSDVAAFIGDMGLLESMSNILTNHQLIVELTFIAPSGASPAAPNDRKWLALHSQEAISSYLKGELS